MSRHQAFARQPVPGQYAQRLNAMTIPAPVRGLVLSENPAFMKPGGAQILDNWKPTLRGLALRGGCIRWCELPETTPVISAFEYASGNTQRMYAGNATKLYEVTTLVPVLIKSGQTSGNYSEAQLANAAGDWLIVVNEAGDLPLRYDGTTWTTLSSNEISGPNGSPVEHGANLVHVNKYRNRLFFIEKNSMNAWYLGIDSIGGALSKIPLSGAATRGGKLLFSATWSIDAGDGIDDKLVFCTDLGELLIFTGSNPSDQNNWRQEGRYQIGKPMGMNAYITLGGDLLIATTDGIVPVSATISKDSQILELAMITANIRSMWREEVAAKKTWAWTMERWDEYGGMFVTWPGGPVGNRLCAVVNTATNAWARFVGYDATCFIRMRGDMFFGTQDGVIMQADRGGYDDGQPYVATMVGGWEMFGSAPNETVWHQARAMFTTKQNQDFNPQLAATIDYNITVPTPPPTVTDFGVLDVWDQGRWDVALWDAEAPPNQPLVRHTGWTSIGMTGFAHAPIVQITVAQAALPDIEYIAMSATFERVGVNV